MGDLNWFGYIVYIFGIFGKFMVVVYVYCVIWVWWMMIFDWYDLCVSDRVFYVGVFNWIFIMGIGLMDFWFVGVISLIFVFEIIIDDILDLLCD